MSKITEIEKAIVSLSPAGFQKFCDTILSQMNLGYIHGLGSKTGTLKTTIGNPDTYFVNPKGKYVFVAYTTQQTQIFGKLKEDIEKCLDTQKTGVMPEDIDEIICCHTSSQLLAGDEKKLRILCEQKGPKLTLLGVDEIAQQVYRNYPRLARDFLGISIDTNQILTIDEFIKIYDSSDTTAPLSTTFLFREKELDTLMQSIRDNRIVIVSGAAGVGKTRIVLEALKHISADAQTKVYCIKNRYLPIYEDLLSYTTGVKTCIFFVDDANESRELELILSHALKEKDSMQIKIVMTVRDYAKKAVIDRVTAFSKPNFIMIPRFSDEELTGFLRSNLQIENIQQLNRIVQIAKGNPRIAFLTGKIGKEKGSLESILDVSDVYESYYSKIVKDQFSGNKKLVVAAGILALFKAVMIDKTEGIEELLTKCSITRYDFCDCIRELATMEIAEIHQEKMAVLSDQCFANYMLYYVFFARKIISFSDVLSMGFVRFKNGIVKAVDTLLHLFDNPELHDYITEEVIKSWNYLEANHTAGFMDFVRAFHSFCPEETMIIVDDKIEKWVNTGNGERVEDIYSLMIQEDILCLLTGFRNSKVLPTVIDLFLSFEEKRGVSSKPSISWLTNNYGLDEESSRQEFKNELIILEVMTKHVHEAEYIPEVVFKYLEYLLSFDSLACYFQQKNSEGYIVVREKSWGILLDVVTREAYTTEIISVIKSYISSAQVYQGGGFLKDDQQYIIELLSKLSCIRLQKNVIIRDVQRMWEKNGIDNVGLYGQFDNDEWNLYSLLEDGWLSSELSYEEYETEKKTAMVNLSEKYNEKDIPNLIEQLNVIAQVLGHSDYSACCCVDVLLESLCRSHEKVNVLFSTIIHVGIDFEINPRIILCSLLNCKRISEIWDGIILMDSSRRNIWQYCLFDVIPEEMIDDMVYKKLLAFLATDTDKDFKVAPNRSLLFLDKFQKINQNVYVECARLIFSKVEYNGFMVRRYFTLLFHEGVYSPERVRNVFSKDMQLLWDIYVYMFEHEAMVDLNGAFLTELLSIDDAWIDSFADAFGRVIQRSDIQYKYHQCSALWQSDKYRVIYDRLFDGIVAQIQPLGEWRLQDAFKHILGSDSSNPEVSQKKEDWVTHYVREHAKDDKVYWLFAALAECDTTLRKKVIETFVSCNAEYETFEKLPLEPNHWGGSVESIIPQIRERIKYLESLLSVFQGKKYIRHAKRVHDLIDIWKKRISNEELEQIYYGILS